MNLVCMKESISLLNLIQVTLIMMVKVTYSQVEKSYYKRFTCSEFRKNIDRPIYDCLAVRLQKVTFVKFLFFDCFACHQFLYQLRLVIERFVLIVYVNNLRQEIPVVLTFRAHFVISHFCNLYLSCSSGAQNTTYFLLFRFCALCGHIKFLWHSFRSIHKLRQCAVYDMKMLRCGFKHCPHKSSLFFKL